MIDWDEILDELSYQVKEGYPNLTKIEHRIKLRKILTDRKWPEEGIDLLMNNLYDTQLTLDESDDNLDSLLNKKIKNPETGRMIKIQTGLSYKTGTTPAQRAGYSVTKQYLTKQGVSDEDIESLEAKSTSDTDDSDTSKSTNDLIKNDHKITDSQLYLTKTQAKIQAKSTSIKNVGAGTPESRAGEAMVHKGIRLLQSGKSIDEIKQEFTKLVNSNDHILNSASGKKWVTSTVSILHQIDSVYKVDNIKTVSWDTKDGRSAIGVSTDLHTSSDMFIQLKDNSVVGISLKKDGKVFLNNGGWKEQSNKILNSLKESLSTKEHSVLSNAMSIKTFQQDRLERFKTISNDITPDDITKMYMKLQNEPKDIQNKLFGGRSRDRYFKILENPQKLLDNVNSGKLSTLEMKAYSKLLAMYSPKKYSYLRHIDSELTRRTFKAIRKYRKTRRAMSNYIMKSMHIMDTLGFNKKLKSGGVDSFVTLYGISPSGAALTEETLNTLFGDTFKFMVKSVRSGNKSISDLETFISDKIELEYDTGRILFKHENNKKYPLFTLMGRSRGIGSLPTMELSQTTFMSYALRMGTFNTDKWPENVVKKLKLDVL